MSKKIAYPGTFDPFHKGHEKIVEKLLIMFDEVYILVFDNSAKNVTISQEKRANAIKQIYCNEKRIIIKSSTISLMDELNKNDIKILGRGIRNSEDIIIEMQRATMIKMIDDIETIFIPSTPDVNFISSTIVRELIILNKDFSKFVSKEIKNLYNKNSTLP